MKAGSRTTRSSCRLNRVFAVSEMIRVALVEDNDVFREALELLLGLRPDMGVVASVADGADAARVVAEVRPDVVLMDYRLPGLDGVQATRAVLDAYPDTAVVCLTASANPREREALVEAGAVDCLQKDEGLDAIVEAIRRASRPAIA
jgi:DNA-binding NarL/FixJ family response regulator